MLHCPVDCGSERQVEKALEPEYDLVKSRPDNRYAVVAT